jgi:hypothetical protein
VPARIFAAIVCLAALAGIGLELSNLLSQGNSLSKAVWILVRFFTILTNGLLVIVFAKIAARGIKAIPPPLLAGTVSAIVLVGIVFALLLQGARPPAGAGAAADFLLHKVAPVLALIFWLTYAPKGNLSWRDPLDWSLFPLVYLIYALIRGHFEGIYAYPFIDVAANGWPQVLLTAAIIAVGFIGAGEVMVWLDGWLARRRPLNQ